MSSRLGPPLDSSTLRGNSNLFVCETFFEFLYLRQPDNVYELAELR